MNTPSLNKDTVIPIRFFGGTGGHFVTCWLTQAKLGRTNDIQLSNYGNSHDGYREFLLVERSLYGFGTYSGGLRSIEGHRFTHFFKNYIPKILPDPPYFVASEAEDLSALIDLYPKTVAITYEQEDASILSKILIAKWGIEENKLARYDYGNLWAIKQNAYAKIRVKTHYFEIHHKLFDPTTIDPRALNLPWRDLFSAPALDIVDKLSSYTDIPKDNFQIKDLMRWRAATQKGIDQIDQYVQESLNNTG